MKGTLIAVSIIGIILGIIALVRPGATMLTIAILFGTYLVDVTAGATGNTRGSRLLAMVRGVVSIIAGIVVFMLPGLAVATFVIFGAILLIIVSATTLLTLPFRAKQPAI